MKGLARSYVWWPNIDTDIEKHVSSCGLCQTTRHSPPRASVHPWETTDTPWSRLHIDFAGPFQGHKFMVLVDSHSKWLEVKEMTTTTASATIDVLRDIFATHGIPDVLVSDNGPPFQSQEYQTFLQSNGVRPVTVAPRRAAGNGQAERVVQSTKDSLRRIVKGSWRKRLAQYLLNQHITPSSVTKLSPSELLMGRRLRSCLDLCHPDFVKDQRRKQEENFEKQSGKVRSFDPEDDVLVRSYAQGSPSWVPAKVTESTGPVSYRVETDNGDTLRRHIDQMIPGIPDPSPETPTVKEPATAASAPLEIQSENATPETPALKSLPSPNVTSRPRRTIRKPERYRD